MSLTDALRKVRELVIGFFGALPRLAIQRPRQVIFIVSVVTLAAAVGVGRLRLRTDAQALVSQNAPEVKYDNAIRDKFGIEDQMVVLVRFAGPQGVFNSETLQLVRELTAEFQRLPGINPSNVTSLATEPSFRLRPGT